MDPTRSRPALTIVSFALVTALVTSCETVLSWIDPPEPLPTIEGTESDALVQRVHGTLLLRQEKFDAVSFPGLARTRVKARGDVRRCDGPDERGRFVYVAGVEPRWHELSTHRDESLFATSEVTVSAVAISPRDGHVLIACGLVRSREPWIEIRELDGGEVRRFESLRVHSASWHPDGKHVAIELWVPIDAAPEPRPKVTITRWADGATPPSDLAPSIQILDVESGSLRWIAWGFEPHVSPDGKRVLYDAPNKTTHRVRELETGDERDVELPGFMRREHYLGKEHGYHVDGVCFGWVSDDAVMYEALATSGVSATPGYVPSGSMQGYYPKYCIKIADVTTLEFKTVVDSADWPVASFGVAPR
jgi:hypothetical protein